MCRKVLDAQLFDPLKHRFQHFLGQEPQVEGYAQGDPAVAKGRCGGQILEGVVREGSDDSRVQGKWRPRIDPHIEAVSVDRSNA